MLSIYKSDINTLAEKHTRRIKDWVEDRINKQVINKKDREILISSLENILQGDQNELIILNEQFMTIFPKKKKRVKRRTQLVNNNKIVNIFNYSEFRKKFGFILSSELKITCCPYCNRNYTTSHETVKMDGKSKKEVFPEFDHFYPVNEYPFLALSFFNLIPSCSICNSHYKQSLDPKKEDIFHPYTKVIIDHFKFKFYPNDYKSLIGKSLDIKIDFEFFDSDSINISIAKSLDKFGIKKIYEECHSDLIKDIIDKRISFSDNYISNLISTYKLPFEDSYRLLFETYYEVEKLHERPFSKIKRDIYNDIEIGKHLV